MKLSSFVMLSSCVAAELSLVVVAAEVSLVVAMVKQSLVVAAAEQSSSRSSYFLDSSWLLLLTAYTF
jgi:hypothetical protein